MTPQGKTSFKPGNMLFPLPAAIVSCAGPDGADNLLTVSWVGTVCTNPPMLSISIRPERYSYAMIEATGEFTVNLTTEAMARATDLVGVRSGRDGDKWALTGLTRLPGAEVKCPAVAESPVNIECRVKQTIPLGSHTMFLADVVGVRVDSSLIDPATCEFQLHRAGLINYSHGHYFVQGRELGRFGFSVKKKK